MLIFGSVNCYRDVTNSNTILVIMFLPKFSNNQQLKNDWFGYSTSTGAYHIQNH